MKKLTKTVLVATILATFTAFAGNAQHEMKPIPSSDELSKQMADQMKTEIAISDKQYNKVLKLFKKEIEDEREIMGQGAPKGMPGGGGMPPMGGGGMPPMGGGGMPPMGGGAMPPMGGPDFGGGRPGPVDMEEVYDQLDALYEKNEGKLKKILTPEQFSQWRAAHPRKRVELPPFEGENANMPRPDFR